METGSGAGHSSEHECLEALHGEIERTQQLRDRICRDRLVRGHRQPLASTLEPADAGEPQVRSR